LKFDLNSKFRFFSHDINGRNEKKNGKIRGFIFNNIGIQPLSISRGGIKILKIFCVQKISTKEMK